MLPENVIYYITQIKTINKNNIKYLYLFIYVI